MLVMKRLEERHSSEVAPLLVFTSTAKHVVRNILAMLGVDEVDGDLFQQLLIQVCYNLLIHMVICQFATLSTQRLFLMGIYAWNMQGGAHPLH